MESDNQIVWVKHGIGRTVKVSVASTADVSDLIEVIKEKLSPKLDSVPLDEIYLHKPEDERKEGGGEYKDGKETAYESDVLVSVILQEEVGELDRPSENLF